MSPRLFFMIFLAATLLVDIYTFQAIKTLWKGSSKWSKIRAVYWSITVVSAIALILYSLRIWEQIGVKMILVTGILMTLFFSKVTMCLVLLVDDLRRLVLKIWKSVFQKRKVDKTISAHKITRSQFLSKSALALSGATLGIMSFGIISGVHDYRVRRRRVEIQGLPKAFDGIKIAQISDIHSGSFFDRIGVQGGVDILMQEKADIIFFTGDLVNNVAKEVTDYIGMFSKVKAPLGVYSVLGNHDYGDYAHWESPQAKAKNLEALIQSHRIMGWDLLMDQNRVIKVDGEEIAILGVQNWGTGRFPKYGHLDKAYQGTEEINTKILLSHDPSHWDAQVRRLYPDIDLTLSGHTHGMQCGVEIGDFRWSPIQWRYKQWADLYHESGQYLYVNRGFGFLGFPGRIGILPEITLLELKSV